jgi:ketosteroid isomerase-like protein
MKKITFILIALITFSVSAQKKKNGTVYVDHPGIQLVNDFYTAWTSGDIEKAASYLSEDFKVKNGNDKNKDNEGANKAQMIDNMTWWYNNNDYLKLTTSEGTYPDAIEYKEGDQIWVQTWDHLYAVNKQTGVEFDDPIHRLYLLNKDSSKIVYISEYNNQNTYRTRNNAWPGNDRENGTIYSNHKNINTVRLSIYSFVNGDYEKSYSYWDENAEVNDINLPDPISLADAKKGNEELTKNFSFDAADEVGYPDYLEYDLWESKDVLSWWKFRMTRKSDGKKIVLPVHYIHGFDNEGKIINVTMYFNASLMQ